jgi:hypothetical protein
MSATIYSTAKFGLASEAASTGLFIASLSYGGTSETALAPNHVGQDVGIGVYNEKIDITASGIIAVKGAGMVPGIADLLVLANTSVDSLNVFTDLLKVTPVANASIIITGATLARSNNGFETGDLTGIYLPGVDTTATYTAS